MGQAVAANNAIGTNDAEKLRHNVTDVLADALAKALARQIINSISMD